MKRQNKKQSCVKLGVLSVQQWFLLIYDAANVTLSQW